MRRGALPSRVPLAVVAAAAVAMALQGCGREYVDLGSASFDASSEAPSVRTDATCAPLPMSNSCTAAGMSCDGKRSICCSGRCDPSLGDGPPVCLGTCQPDGTSCGSPQDCCSLACNNQMCGGPLCLTNNTFCNNDADCCSSHCHMNQCTIEHDEQCLPTGEACGPDAGTHCCSGDCNGRTGRCDFGGGPCLDPSSPCGEPNVTCCAGPGACTPNAQGAMECASGCLGEGTPCNFSGECCGETTCAGSPSPVCTSLPVCE